MNINSALYIDGYKTDHRRQYPNGTNLVYSNLTARKSRHEDIDHIVFFGLQYFCLKHLLEDWQENFFDQNEEKVISDYHTTLFNYLGPNDVGVEHIRALHRLGYLPLKIKAVKEGTKVPINTPCLTIYNTHPDFFWLTNYFETILSAMIWGGCTSATIANRYRKVFNNYAELTGADPNFVPFQGHDFSMRGMYGDTAFLISGAAHLLSFVGTDTIPAIKFLEEYYGAKPSEELVGCSVAATEHSVMCMGGDLGEFETFQRLITEIYPKGIVSIVSDTWDFWQVITDFLPRLKNEIMARDGKVVIRPDSGDPILICCGDPNAETEWERKGAIECLWDTFGGTINLVDVSCGTIGYKQLDPHIGLIYGDSITLERQNQILGRLKDKYFSSTNMVFGIGSYTYQFNTRDTFGFAMKATYGEIEGKGINIFKDPATDKDKMKKSHKGLMRLNADMTLDQEVTWEEEEEGILEDVFVDGKLVRRQTLAEIRVILSQ